MMVRGRVNIDLHEFVDKGFRPLGELVADPVQLAEVLYFRCKGPANARNVSD